MSVTVVAKCIVTEEEIYRGLMDDPDPGSHCLAFIRNITDVDLQHKKAWRFVDQNSDGSTNTDAQQRKSSLHKMVNDNLPQQNVFK